MKTETLIAALQAHRTGLQGLDEAPVAPVLVDGLVISLHLALLLAAENLVSGAESDDAAVAEREACAKVADDEASESRCSECERACSMTAAAIAANIRKRSNV